MIKTIITKLAKAILKNKKRLTLELNVSKDSIVVTLGCFENSNWWHPIKVSKLDLGD